MDSAFISNPYRSLYYRGSVYEFLESFGPGRAVNSLVDAVRFRAGLSGLWLNGASSRCLQLRAEAHREWVECGRVARTVIQTEEGPLSTARSVVTAVVALASIAAGTFVGWEAGRRTGVAHIEFEADELQAAMSSGSDGADWLAAVAMNNDLSSIAAQCLTKVTADGNACRVLVRFKAPIEAGP